ncbi:DNA-3-methyladenine glycosylase I [Devosia sp. WQ 349]|uniref:DNA-3-methyladenine glycosylase I n=1 Tax=Devosia sp. WQ 349K1 TaxID=2800329 RepID=UPI001907F526|nr:DNA-3-methyladenine glycosylase I [Devosia sp. WQ 349K1]MBK1795988.1 DNA-3-methyladenine glycosylase I [Devosia sp. WQ 349K1]
MSLVTGPDGAPRCGWCGEIAEFFPYHDHEWGFPVVDDRRLFEKISLEGFQSGLSWRTILNKRENFRRGFANFEIDAVAQFTQDDVERLLQNSGIVRHRGKIEAVINNAQRAQELIKEAGSIAGFVWQYEAKTLSPPQSQTTSAEAIALSKALKKRGWKFVGPTTVFAFMQAMGLVNDHHEGCVTRAKAAAARAASSPPQRQ